MQATCNASRRVPFRVSPLLLLTPPLLLLLLLVVVSHCFTSSALDVAEPTHDDNIMFQWRLMPFAGGPPPRALAATCGGSFWCFVSLSSSSPSSSSSLSLLVHRIFFDERATTSNELGSPIPLPYDPDDFSGIVVYGRTSDPIHYNMVFDDLWVLNPQDDHPDGRTWTLVPVSPMSPVPAARCLAAVAVNPSDGVMYMYGGFNGTNWFAGLRYM